MRLGTNACLNDLEIRGTKEDILAFLQGLYGYTSIYNRYNKLEKDFVKVPTKVKMKRTLRIIFLTKMWARRLE